MDFKIKSKQLVNDPAIFANLEIFANLIQKNNQFFNLTSWDLKTIWEKGIYQSLIVYQKWLDHFNHKSVLDIGTGAGFPSLVLKIFNPKMDLTVSEPNNKKRNFLNQVQQILNLDFKITSSRVEKMTSQFDCILARAVSSLANLIQISYHLGKNNSLFLFIKGPKIFTEIEEAKTIIQKCKIKYQIDNNFINNTYLFVFVKKTKTPLGWPLDWKVIAKNKKIIKS